jgi:hypothetical protein
MANSGGAQASRRRLAAYRWRAHCGMALRMVKPRDQRDMALGNGAGWA